MKKPKTYKQEFLALVDRFCVKHQVLDGELGSAAVNNPSFLPRLRRKGATTTFATADKVRDWMRERARKGGGSER